MRIIIAIVLLIINIPIYKKIFYFVFQNKDDFNNSVKYSFTPDLFSLFKGNYWKDQVGEAKLSTFLLLCVMLVAIEYFIVISLLGRFI